MLSIPAIFAVFIADGKNDHHYHGSEVPVHSR